MKRVFEKLIHWMIFSVLLALVPLVFSAFRLFSRGNFSSLDASITDVLSRGELLLIAAILCAGASGEVFKSGPSFRILKTISTGGAILLLLFSALYFADVTALQLSGGHMDGSLIQQTSLQVFLASVVCSASCVALAELQ